MLCRISLVLALLLAGMGAELAHAATCGIQLNATSLNFQTAERGGLSEQRTLTLSNGAGADAVATVTVSGKNWLSSVTGLDHIFGYFTRFAVNSDAVPDASNTPYDSKTPLNNTDTPVFVGTINPGATNSTYLQVRAALHNLPFVGDLSQAITYTAAC